MSTPVKYGDISREANDLFTKDYPLDTTKFDVKTTQPSGEAYSIKSSYDPKSGKLTGTEVAIDLKPKKGVSLNTALALDASSISNTLKITDQSTYLKSIPGLTAKIDTKVPVDLSAGKTAEVKVSADYAHKRFIWSGVFDQTKNALTTDAVSVYKGFVFGTQVGINAKSFDVTKYEGTVGYTYGKYAGAVSLTDKATSVSSWLFAAITPYLDGCLQTKYDLNKNNTTAEAATKFYYDKDTTFKAKVNSDLQLGISSTLNVNSAMKMTYSVLTDLKKTDKLVHKMGASISFSA